MEKKTITEYIEGHTLWTDENCGSVPIDEFIEALIKAKEQGATDVEIEVDVSWGQEEINSTRVTAFYTREETNEELQERIDQDKKNQETYDAIVLNQERIQYLKLKKKFEPNV